jgi:opacity protein-like surface antigen
MLCIPMTDFQRTRAMCTHAKTLVAAVAFTFTAPAVSAGGMAESTATPQTIAPRVAAHDWSGLYGGVQLAYHEPSGFSDAGFYVDDPFEAAPAGGLFAGYNFQTRAFVYGAEVLASFYEGENEAFPGEFLEHVLEVRGRAGYAFQDVLIYGALGLSSQTWSDNVGDITLNGYSAALGVDYAINDAWFVGGEVSYREVSNARYSRHRQAGGQRRGSSRAGIPGPDFVRGTPSSDQPKTGGSNHPASQSDEKGT